MGDLFIRKSTENGLLLNEDGAVPLLQSPLLMKLPGVRHGFSTRLGGVSEGIFESLNLSWNRGDDPAKVAENYTRVAAALDTTPDRMVATKQTHTDNIRIVTEADAGCGVTRERTYADTDGLITNVPGLLLCVFTADCVPVLLYDPVHKAVGAVHAGWRGTAAGIAGKAVRMMQDVYGTNPEDIFCAIGPSICRDCYEVSADVAEVFLKTFSGEDGRIVYPKALGRRTDEIGMRRYPTAAGESDEKREERENLYKKGSSTNTEAAGSNDKKTEAAAIVPERKYLLDLWEANCVCLEREGVPREQISVTDLCTACNENLLFSHRASKGKRGVLGAFIGLYI